MICDAAVARSSVTECVPALSSHSASQSLPSDFCISIVSSVDCAPFSVKVSDPGVKLLPPLSDNNVVRSCSAVPAAVGEPSEFISPKLPALSLNSA